MSFQLSFETEGLPKVTGSHVHCIEVTLCRKRCMTESP